MAEVLHQKKLLAFLLSFPILVMLLIGTSFGDVKAADYLSGGSYLELTDAWTKLNDSELASVLSALTAEESMSHNTTVVYAGAYLGMESSPLGDKVALFFLPSEINRVLLIGRDTFVYLEIDGESEVTNCYLGPIHEIVEYFGESRRDRDNEYRIEGLSSHSEMMNLLSQSPEVSSKVNLGAVGEINPGTRLIDLLIPDFIGMIIMWTAILGTAITVVEDKNSGVRKRILLTPTSKLSLVAGNVLSSLILVMIQVFVLLTIAILVFGVRIAGSVSLLLLVIMTATVSMIGIGLVVSYFARTPDEAFYLSMMITFPMMLFGTIFFTMNRSGWIGTVSQFMPLRYINDALRAVVVHSASFADVLPHLLVILGFGLLVFALSTCLACREGSRERVGNAACDSGSPSA